MSDPSAAAAIVSAERRAEASPVVAISVFDLPARNATERADLHACLDELLDKGDFVLGDSVAQFERAIQTYVGTRHCVSVNSGTDALIIGLKAMNIGPGDEVIVPPASFIASVAAIHHVGAVPVFSDVGTDLLLDPIKLHETIANHPRAKAVMPVHWTGRICDMHGIQNLAQQYGLKIIEDACQAMGGLYWGKHAGQQSCCAAFSAHPLKAMGGLGDGGFLVTNNDEIAQFARLYRNHGLASRDRCVMLGVNSRLDTLHAKVLLRRLADLNDVIGMRRRNVELYRRLIRAPQVRLPHERAHERLPYTVFLVQAEGRDRLQRFLAEQDIQTLVYYGTPLHLQPACAHLGYKWGDFPVAEHMADRVLALPHHQHMSEDQVEFVAGRVNAFYAGA